MPETASPRRTAGPKPALAAFSAVAAAWVFVLVALGAFTTSIGAGMAFPDWPLSNGSIDPKGWLSNLSMFAEHSHRLSAMVMGTLTGILAVWLHLRESRPWLRKMGYFAFALVVVQGILGGLRVLLNSVQVPSLETSVGRLLAMLHACVAQAFACVLIAIALSLSRCWIERGVPVGPGVRRAGLLCCAVIFVQLGVAAVMRHSFAGLAIPTFPWSTTDHHLLPDDWNFGVAINFTHRVVALLVAAAIVVFFAAIWRDPASRGVLKGGSLLLAGLVAVQITLGAFVILTYRNPAVTTSHVLVGALTLVTTFFLTWLAHRDAIQGGPRRMTETATAHARISDYVELTKPRLSLLSVLTALVGYFAARPLHAPLMKVVWLAVGTSLAAGGVAALNQMIEKDTDARMKRTASRPIPAGRIADGSAYVLGWGMCFAALVIIFTQVGKLSALFTLLTIASYLGWYTPAKRRSRWSTEIGAIAGAFPPLIGWSAVEGGVSSLGWILFGILVFWQIPHFMAIAWIYRKDYSAVNFPMLPVRDQAGGKVAGWSLVATAVLLVLSVAPAFMGLDSAWYGAVAAAVGAWFLVCALLFVRKEARDASARRLFHASLAYLPIVLGALVADRLLLPR